MCVRCVFDVCLLIAVIPLFIQVGGTDVNVNFTVGICPILVLNLLGDCFVTRNDAYELNKDAQT